MHVGAYIQAILYHPNMSIYEVPIQNQSYDLVVEVDDIELDMPPAVSYAEWYGDGKFEFIHDKSTRKLLCNAHEAISKCELWSWLATFDEPSFLWSTSCELAKLNAYIWKTDVGSYHSGASFAYTMREMERIAKYGYAAYRESRSVSISS